MKNLLVILVLVLAVITAQAQNFRKFALVVGVAKYENPQLNLNYSDDDAYRFYAYLKSPEGGALPDEHVAVLIDEAATKNNIINTMHQVFSKSSPEDMLIFYFSGHGAEGAFCPTDITNQYSSLLSHDELKAVFKKYPAKYKVCFADACHSGSIYQGRPAKQPGTSSSTASETNVVLIMSSKPEEYSQENPKIRQGFFTYYLLKGLKGSADRNSDKIVTLEELFPYIKANVLNFSENRQTPIIEGNASRYMPIGFLR